MIRRFDVEMLDQIRKLMVISSGPQSVVPWFQVARQILRLDGTTDRYYKSVCVKCCHTVNLIYFNNILQL